MNHINFESTLNNGYIKVPEKYYRMNNRRVIVNIIDDDGFLNEKVDQTEREKNMKDFLHACTGILESKGISPDITMKDIREMRLNDTYDI